MSPEAKRHKIELQNNRRRSHLEWCASFKESQGCTDCGITDSRVLDFDHLPEYKKDFVIAKGYSKSLEVIKAEVAKCEVVCANCHRIRTYERRK